MTIYAIGDVQGCYAPLQRLLDSIAFDPANDKLWFTGDLVNRGPDSLEVLRFVKSLGDHQVTVLGNHDLHLLAMAHGFVRHARGDTLDAILTAPDRHELIEWLRNRPLVHVDQVRRVALVHAGLAPCWSLPKAIQLAVEVETVLRSDHPEALFAELYGNQPDQWSDQWKGAARWRCIINFLTRMRFCYDDGRMELEYKGTVADAPPGLMPWFKVPGRVPIEDAILFGHWAALGGQTNQPGLFALDTGCVWGNSLTALRLDDFKVFSVPCSVC